MDSDDPPRKNYDFKERAFKRDNPRASEAPPVPTAKELAIMAGHKAAPPAKPDRTAAKAGDPNDIYAVLEQNRVVEQNMGRDVVEIKKKKSRRKRDYWLVLIGGNLLTAGLVALGRFNPISLIYGVAGVVVFSIGLTWIMWFVVDDY
jgi:hypothetical protein